MEDLIMGRKLATIQTIKEINPIPGADKIEVASVLGWKVVIRKGEFKAGESCVYCEIDSILPEKPEFEFLKDRKYRIRTVRLRKQLSQGICFPLTILPKDTPIEIDSDVTEILGIEKFMPQIPANISGTVKGGFPSFVPKTDETRIQVLQDVLTKFKGTKCYVTEKVDGSSATYFYRKGQFGVCSRNLELKETEENLFWKMARELKLEEKLKSLGYNVSIQGELIGPGIQKNPLKLEGHKVLFFNVFDTDKFKYLNFEEFKDTIVNLGLETVPILETDFKLEDNIDNLTEKAKGVSALNSKVFREGIVFRPLKEEFDFQMSQGFNNGRVSFKAVNPDYLLKVAE
jgi:RNA ligase (TIGR02306 family)